jgi:hypothetical protein
MDDDEILLLLQEDKRLTSMKGPEGASGYRKGYIAVCALKNQKRSNLRLHNTIMFPAFTMVGTKRQYSTKLPSVLH